MTTFRIGQDFLDDYPVEAAIWCNDNGCYIQEMESEMEGHRKFVILRVPSPTEDELRAEAIAKATSLEARLSALEDALAEMIGGM